MESINTRIQTAESLWLLGAEAERSENYPLAYRHYTEAHDLIMDCARLHQLSHVKLRRVNYKLGNYGEFLTDWLLHCFAPLGVFELVSRLSKTDAWGSIICKRNAA
ncbi:MAG: hypothetical protein H6984_13730 [Pseudomonadales bacterium]|nr:hypothetical protein [Pseudomonadales bacterium]MCP5193652.1 hypothetical protein [Pseudomonadales bacterium]